MNSPLEERIKSALDVNSQQLDTQTLQALQVARRKALNREAKPNWLTFSAWVPAAGLAFCVVMAMLILPNHQSQQPMASVEQTAMLELLDNPEDIDTLSDPDFYMWMDVMEAESKDNHAV